MAYIFAQRVSDVSVLKQWISQNIPKEHIVREQCLSSGLVQHTVGSGVADYRIVLDNATSARKLRDYMDGITFAGYIIHRMNYFRTSWYPLRPRNLE